MADGVLAIDEYHHVVTYNGAALNLLDKNEIRPKTSIAEIMTIIDKTGQPVDVVNLIDHANTQTSYRDYRLVYDNEGKDYISLYLSIAPVHLGYGSQGIRGHVLLIRDITREKSLEEERDEFISVVSHELRTPIAIAEGNLSNALFMAEKHQLETSTLDAIQQSYDQVLLLSKMINDLSTLSRAERGKLEVEIEPINCSELVDLLAKEYSPQAESKGLSIRSHADPHLEILNSSRLYVREILQNFITNAIKYTESGHVTIAAKPYEKGVIFEVSDTGVGISKQDKERIFDKFFRSEDYRTREANGTGLGLYVTLKLSKLIHAEIDVTSHLNQGSTFSIKVPNMT